VFIVCVCVCVHTHTCGCDSDRDREILCLCVFKQSSSYKHLIATTLPEKIGSTGKYNKISSVFVIEANLFF
jgi:hypothetical protein